MFKCLIKFLQLFFEKFPQVNIREFLGAPYQIYKDEDHFPLSFYTTQKAISIYSAVQKHKKEELPEIRKYLKKNYPDYTVQTYAVDFFGGGGGSTALYQRADVFAVINGKTFCKFMGIDYDIVCANLEVDRDENFKFIKGYITTMNKIVL